MSSAAKERDGALQRTHLYARASVATFLVALIALPVIAASSDGSEDPPAASADAGDAPESTDTLVTDATGDPSAPQRAIAGLSNGFELRADAQEQAQAQADAEQAQVVADVEVVTESPAQVPTTPPTTSEPTTTAPPAPPTTADAPPVGSGIWDEIAACESGGNWAINTGNGYYGGLQFLLSTWQIHGGSAFAAYPHQASREQQIAVGERVVAAAGGSYGAWGACAASLGLP